MLEFDFDGATRTLTCVFSGRLDTAKCLEIEKTVFDRIGEVSEPNKPARVIFDLAGVEYVTSAFLRLCLKAARSAADGSFAVVNTNPLIKKIFKIAGFDQTLNVS